MGTEANRQPGTVPTLPIALGERVRLDVNDSDELEILVLNRSTGRWEAKYRFTPGPGTVVI